MIADPLARIELLARALRSAAGRSVPRWLVLSRFGFDFLGATLERERPTEVVGVGTMRRATLNGVPVLTLDRETVPGEGGVEADALCDALAIFAAARAGLSGVVQCIAAASLVDAITTPSFALVRDWLRWNEEDPLRGLPTAKLGARYPDLRGLHDSKEFRAVAPICSAQELHSAVAVARRGPTGASRAEFEAMRRLGGELVVEAGAAEMVAALQQGLYGVTIALVLDAALQLPPADPGALAAAADRLLPDLTPLLADVIARLDAIAAEGDAPAADVELES